MSKNMSELTEWRKLNIGIGHETYVSGSVNQLTKKQDIK